VLPLLADAAQTDKGVDWSTLSTPAGVIMGAAIAGFVAWRNARVSPQGRLQTMIGLYQDWPEGLEGRDTVEQSIAVTLARIRRREKHPAGAVSPSEQKADREVSVAARRETKVTVVSLIAAVITAAIGAIAAFAANSSATSSSASQSASSWLAIAVTGATLVTVTVATFIATRRR
jgi:hypothetical protein